VGHGEATRHGSPIQDAAARRRAIIHFTFSQPG
jgi:hypothetical protein